MGMWSGRPDRRFYFLTGFFGGVISAPIEVSGRRQRQNLTAAFCYRERVDDLFIAGQL